MWEYGVYRVHVFGETVEDASYRSDVEEAKRIAQHCLQQLTMEERGCSQWTQEVAHGPDHSEHRCKG